MDKETQRLMKFLLHAMVELRGNLHSLGGFTYMIKEDEYRPLMGALERKTALCHQEDCLWKLSRKVNALVNLAYYSTAPGVERSDKVLVNLLCRELAEEQDVRVLYESDIPDFFAITTNQQCLSEVLGILLSEAADRVSRRKCTDGEPLVTLSVTERGEKGRLTFIITDTGDPTTVEEDTHTFDLPTAPDQFVVRKVEIINCRLIVGLLGGLLYIDPHYKDGRRVIFDITMR